LVWSGSPQIVKYNYDHQDVVIIYEQNSVLFKLKHNLNWAKQIIEKNVNKNRVHVDFKVDYKALVRLQFYKQHFIALRQNQELSFRYCEKKSWIDRF